MVAHLAGGGWLGGSRRMAGRRPAAERGRSAATGSRRYVRRPCPVPHRMNLAYAWLRGLAATLLATACAGAPPRRTSPAAPGAESAGVGGGHALTGVVRDARSDALVAEAYVSLLADTGRGTRPLRSAATDGRGRYRMESIPTGGYLVRVQRIGYHTDTVRVQVGDCGYVVQSGRSTSYCEDRRNFYIRPATRF